MSRRGQATGWIPVSSGYWMFVNWHNVASVTSGPVIVSSVHCLHTRHPTGSSPSLVSVSSPSEKKRFFLGGTSNGWDEHPPRPGLVVSRQTAASLQTARVPVHNIIVSASTLGSISTHTRPEAYPLMAHPYTRPWVWGMR